MRWLLPQVLAARGRRHTPGLESDRWRSTTDPMSTLLLLDGHSLAYRAFYALPTDLATSSGQVTNAVYGFTSMLIKVVGDEKPDHLAVAFDTAAPTFRKEKDSTYKAGRKETPDLFRSQLPLIRQVLEALAVPSSRSTASRPTT